MSVHEATFLIPLSFPQEPKVVPEAPTGAATTQTPGPAGAGGAGGAPAGSCMDPQLMLMMGGFVALMYFMVLRPENKRRKEMAALLASIKVGDKVVTNAGLHGVVHRLEETTVTLLVDTVKMTFDRQAIARIDRGEATPPSK
jgi:preprotein translocase subunit YajC